MGLAQARPNHVADLSQPFYQRRSASAAFHLAIASLRTLSVL